MQWSPVQLEALRDVGEWLERADRPFYKLFGYAGTGKTTLARHFAEGVPGTVLFGAYTGKAALVLQQRGCPGATTLHRLIYKPKEKSRRRLLELQQERLDAPAERWEELDALVALEQQALRRPSFALSPDSAVRTAALVVVDEVSMVGQRMGEDLLSFGTPVLVLGDPAQLPPVGDGGFFTSSKPDCMLTEIHRQAAGSPIIALATAAREGRTLELGEYGESRVLARGGMDVHEVAAYDQILVGRNKTRKAVNRRIREEVHGRASHLPEPGDKLVCLRNDHEVGLLNGSTWVVRQAEIQDDDVVQLVLTDTADEANLISCPVHRHHFEDRDVPIWLRPEAQEFDYGYALTCHKAQGSQWERVVVVDESSCFRQDARKWLYTAITRASESVVVVQ